MSGPIRNFERRGPILRFGAKPKPDRALPPGKQWIAHSGNRQRERNLRRLAIEAAKERARHSAAGTFRCEACLEDYQPEKAKRTTTNQLVCEGCAEYLYVEQK